MVVLPIGVTQAEHEPRRAEVACGTDERALSGSIAFHLNPFAPATGVYRPSACLATTPSRRQQRQPIAREIDVSSLLDVLQTRMPPTEDL